MVEFKDFVAGMSVAGFVSKDVFDGALFQYKLPVSRVYIDAIQKSLKLNGYERISYNGAYYRLSPSEPAIYSTAPFNVTGFTGDDVQMGTYALLELSKMIDEAITDYKSGANHWSLNESHFMVKPPSIARHFARKWCYQAVDYIGKHLCYGMFKPLWKDLSLIDTDDSLCIWDSVLNNAPFEVVFVQADDLTKLPGMLNFKKILNHFERVFSVIGHNTDVYKAVSDVLMESFATRRQYSDRDVFSVAWRNDFEQILFFDKENPHPLAICDTRIDDAGAPINRWMHGLNCVLMDAGEHAIFGEFLKAFCGCRGPGNTFDCGAFKVRFCKYHLNITIPHNYVSLINRFMAKYGFDFGSPHERAA